MQGKILAVDVSGVSPVYGHLANKELVDCVLAQLVHPDDTHKVLSAVPRSFGNHRRRC